MKLSIETSSGHLMFIHAIEEAGNKELFITVQELNQLKGLVDILKPFREATDLSLVEKIFTICSVVRFVFSLNHHLLKWKPLIQFLSKDSKHP